MRLLLTFLVAMTLITGVAFGQEKGREKSFLPEHVSKELQHFVGEWNLEGQGRLGAIKGKWKAKWARGKQCLLIDYQGSIGDETFRGNGMWGWDSANEEFLVVIFFTHDVVEVIHTKIVSANVFQGRYTGQAKGQSFDAKAELQKEGKDSWTFTTTDATLGGEKSEGLSVTLTRAKKAADPADPTQTPTPDSAPSPPDGECR